MADPLLSASGRRDRRRYKHCELCLRGPCGAGQYDVAEIQQAHDLLGPTLGSSAASTLFGVALLAAGQQSTLTGTMAGQARWRRIFSASAARLRRMFGASAAADFRLRAGALRGGRV